MDVPSSHAGQGDLAPAEGPINMPQTTQLRRPLLKGDRDLGGRARLGAGPRPSRPTGRRAVSTVSATRGERLAADGAGPGRKRGLSSLRVVGGGALGVGRPPGGGRGGVAGPAPRGQARAQAVVRRKLVGRLRFPAPRAGLEAVEELSGHGALAISPRGVLLARRGEAEALRTPIIRYPPSTVRGASLAAVLSPAHDRHSALRYRPGRAGALRLAPPRPREPRGEFARLAREEKP